MTGRLVLLALAALCQGKAKQHTEYHSDRGFDSRHRSLNFQETFRLKGSNSKILAMIWR